MSRGRAGNVGADGRAHDGSASDHRGSVSDAKARIDKWLWATRFFKTRSLAQQAVQKGRIRVGDDDVKPSRDVRVGEVVTIDIESGRWVVVVRGISEVRGPAPVARLLYEETEESAKAREAERTRRQLFREPADALHGRPTKRERRVIARVESASRDTSDGWSDRD
jgi:ribosome-associated heat shock protein Hsp15